MSKPKAITDETFEAEVQQAGKPVLVDFWAEWCGPCKMISPMLDEIADEKAEDLTVLKLDVTANPNSALQHGVMGIPALLLFKEGKVVERINGYLPKPKFLGILEPHLN